MQKHSRATIPADKAREMQQAILEGEYSFGLKGQLNISIPRHGGEESHNAYRKRTEALAADLVEYLHVDPQMVFAQKGRIVIKNPNQDMPFILATLEIPVEWEGFAKGVEVSEHPLKAPSGNATLIGFIQQKSTVGGPDMLSVPDTHVGRLLAERALAPEKGGHSY